MPVSPYIWNTRDFLTASLLNGELYRTLGQYYQANGIGFHAVRPVYKAFYGTNQGITAGSWQSIGNATPGSWPVVVDDAGYLGYRGDWENRGIYRLFGLANGGGGNAGANNPAGGLGIVFTTMPFGTGTGFIEAGLGPTTGTGPLTLGAVQNLNSANASAPWALDLMDLNASGAVTAWVGGSGSPKNQLSQADGSNESVTLQSFWVSAYPGNGNTIATLPAPTTTWTSTSPALTASYMNGTAGIAQVMNLLNMPPVLRAVGLASNTSVPNITFTTCKYNTATYDTYGAYNTSTFTYTVPLSGLYLVYNCFPFGSIGTVAVRSGVSVNGTDYMGPVQIAAGGDAGAGTKVQIFSLNAGDTIVPLCNQQSGSTQTGISTFNGTFVVAFLGMQGAPASLPSVPDFTYSWQAGTPASSMPGLMNAHFANDLLYLTQRPYLMAYQNTAQTGIAMNTPTTITMNSITGIVHGDAGDNYSGWSSGTYTAQRAGWYLGVEEFFMATPTLTSTPTNKAAFRVNPAGGATPDYYAGANSYNGAEAGATAVSMYYLRPGDQITPTLYTNNTSSTTTSTIVNTGRNSHFELVWLGE